MQISSEKIPLGIKISNKEPYNVFVVDDSPTVRHIIKRSFIRLSFNIIGEAGNGEQAMERLKQAPILPDIVCIDQEMPIMNGTQTIKELKKYFPNLKIIFITSHAEGHFVKEVLQLGVHSYIVKPFDLESLTRD